jgi:uncharacterized protein YndB with AHSA1/START domain
MSSTDRIEKVVHLKAPVSRVFRAIADPVEFGRWFGVEIVGRFAPGEAVRAKFAALPPQEVFDELARRAGAEPTPVAAPGPDAVFCVIERIEPETYLSFRWIPFGVDASIDPATEPMTLVELRLTPEAGGTRLTITESGFDRVPAHRRARALRMNDYGWSAQAENVKKHVESGPEAA